MDIKKVGECESTKTLEIMRKYDLLIFDMDGTILNTIVDITDSLNYAMKTSGFPEHTNEQVRDYVGSGARVLVERALKAVAQFDATDEEKRAELVSLFRTYYKEHCREKTAPFKGIEDLLKKLREAGYKLAVVSNKPNESVQILVDKYFNGLFDFALGESEEIAAKPSPDMVNKCLEQFNVKRDRAIYIGDSDVDYLTSVNSGLDVILVTWGFKDVSFLKTFNAKNYVYTPEEILDIV